MTPKVLSKVEVKQLKDAPVVIMLPVIIVSVSRLQERRPPRRMGQPHVDTNDERLSKLGSDLTF